MTGGEFTQAQKREMYEVVAILLRHKGKIRAIKFWRQMTGQPLKEAWSVIEAVKAVHPKLQDLK